MSPLAILLLVVGGLLITIGAVWCAHRAGMNQRRLDEQRAQLCREARARGEREAARTIQEIKRRYAVRAAQKRNRPADFPRKSER